GRVDHRAEVDRLDPRAERAAGHDAVIQLLDRRLGGQALLAARSDESHDGNLLGESGLRWKRPVAPGAQTVRLSGAGPVGACLAVRTPRPLPFTRSTVVHVLSCPPTWPHR